MHDGKGHFAINFWPSVGGVALGGAVACAYGRWGPAEFVAHLMFIAAPVFFALQIGSIAAGLAERKSRSSIVALAISFVAIGLAIGASAHRPIRYILIGPLTSVLWLATLATATLAGIIAPDLKNGRVKKCTAILILLLTTTVFSAWPLVGRLLDHPNRTPRELATALCLLPLGPWTPTAPHLPDFGRLFELAFASGLTVALVVVTAIVFKAKRPERAAAALLVFAALLLGWFAVACIRLAAGRG